MFTVCALVALVMVQVAVLLDAGNRPCVGLGLNWPWCFGGYFRSAGTGEKTHQGATTSINNDVTDLTESPNEYFPEGGGAGGGRGRAGIAKKLLSSQKLHLALGSGNNMNNSSGECKSSNGTAVSTPELSKDPKEPVRKCSSNVKFQPEPLKSISSALAVMGKELVVLCLEWLTKGLSLSRGWQGMWQQLPTEPAFMWHGLRCGGSWNRRALVQLCRAEANEEKTEKKKTQQQRDASASCFYCRFPQNDIFRPSLI